MDNGQKNLILGIGLGALAVWLIYRARRGTLGLAALGSGGCCGGCAGMASGSQPCGSLVAVSAGTGAGNYQQGSGPTYVRGF